MRIKLCLKNFFQLALVKSSPFMNVILYKAYILNKSLFLRGGAFTVTAL